MVDYSVFAQRWSQGKNQVLSASVISDLDTPVSALLKLSQGRPYSFLLESVQSGNVRDRYSIIGCDPDLIWRCERGGKISVNREALTKADAFAPSPRTPLDDLRALLAECKIDDPDQPKPVAAGLFGYLGYDMVRYMERLEDSKQPGIDVPEAAMIRPTLLAIFDQIENKITLVTPAWHDKKLSPDKAYEAAQQRLAQALDRLKQPMPAESAAPHADLPEPVGNMSESDYVGMVGKAKEYIKAGDIFQVVLSQRFSVPFAQSPLALYRAIRRLDPSPYLYYFNFGAFAVVGSSPEVLVRLREGKITIRPIAGTRPRNQSNRTDAELEAELLADPKELAEHLMLLDLGRNDVGRCAKMGTVKVTARNTIEYYKHVMHIVSNVEGELAPEKDALDALIGGFPAGTVSGAPKIRAMQIIAEQEPDRRGIYGGCVGYFAANGDMDTAIAIRTAVVKDGQVHVQAGAGVVYDSDPQSEYRECVAKARGMLRAAAEAAKAS